MKITKKKGQISQLQPLVIALVTIGITIVVGLLIMSTIKANATVAADANATNAISATQTAMSSIPTWLPIIVIVVIGALLIGLVTFFRGGT